MSSSSQLAALRKKLRLFAPLYVTRELVDQIIAANELSYTIAELCHRKIIAPIKKGVLYCNLQKEEIINPYIVGALYCKGFSYMFGGLSIYNRYGYTTQVAERKIIYNTQISEQKTIVGQKFIFKKVRPSFFWGTQERVVDKQPVVIMSPERALLQMLAEQEKLEFVTHLPISIDPAYIQDLAQQYCTKKVLSRLSRLING